MLTALREKELFRIWSTEFLTPGRSDQVFKKEYSRITLEMNKIE
jgi:hypothetical protein